MGADTSPAYAREKANHCDKSMPVSEVHLLVKFVKEDFALQPGNAMCGTTAFAAILYSCDTLKPRVHLVLLLYMRVNSCSFMRTNCLHRSLMIEPSEAKILHKTVRNNVIAAELFPYHMHILPQPENIIFHETTCKVPDPKEIPGKWEKDASCH